MFHIYKVHLNAFRKHISFQEAFPESCVSMLLVGSCCFVANALFTSAALLSISCLLQLSFFLLYILKKQKLLTFYSLIPWPYIHSSINVCFYIFHTLIFFLFIFILYSNIITASIWFKVSWRFFSFSAWTVIVSANLIIDIFSLYILTSGLGFTLLSKLTSSIFFNTNKVNLKWQFMYKNIFNFVG